MEFKNLLAAAIMQRAAGLRSDVGDPRGSLHSKMNLLLHDVGQVFNSIGPGTSDLTVSTNTSLKEGIYRYNTLTVNSSTTLSTTGRGLVIVANSIIINGLISASGKGGLGASGYTGSGPSPGNSAASLVSVGGAGGGGGAADYKYSGGSSPSEEGDGGRGGNTAYAAGGAGGFVTSSTNMDDVSGDPGEANTVCHWGAGVNWLTIGDVFCGAGGGAGGDDGIAGGAGGGYIILVAKSITIGATGAVRADGLSGGNAVSTSSTAGGAGGGGGGGTVVLSCGTLTNNGVLSANGGSGGTSSVTGDYHGGAGGNGGNGIVLASTW